MDPEEDVEARFDAFVRQLAEIVGHADRREPLRAYCVGLVLPGERKSVEPMAARVDPERVRARHQSMHHFVANADWNDHAVMGFVQDYALAAIRTHGPLEAWIVDDTGFPKKGDHSVGVANQYCGVLGKNANSQCAVSISLANRTASVPAAFRLYLPEVWANDYTRRYKARVPTDVTFMTKWQIAITLLDELIVDGTPIAPVVADAGYGDVVAFRDALAARGLTYTVGISKTTSVWPPGEAPLPPPAYSGRGRRPKLLRRDPDHRPISAKELAESLPSEDWCEVEWRQGSTGAMRSRFSRLRIRPAHRDHEREEARAEEWLLIEWPPGESEPTKYWLSRRSLETPVAELVHEAKLRWRIERDFQELKDEIGLDHYEGRGWRGFHHHATLCIAAYGFILTERARLSPPRARAILRLQEPALPDDSGDGRASPPS